MTVTLNLNELIIGTIKTKEYDASESFVLNTDTIPLVVGVSRKGVFNRPTFHQDSKNFNQVYGPIDTFLERRGSFFHRSCYTCLSVGPIFALNLLKLNNDPNDPDGIPQDIIPYQSFSLSTTETNGYKKWELYSSFYRKVGYWKESTDYFIENVRKPSSPNKGKLLSITNLGQTPFTAFITKSKRTGVANKFDGLTANEFFKNNVPTYIDPYDRISDYFIDVTLIQGDWTNYDKLSIDPVFGKYFNKHGVVKKTFSEFLASPDITNIGTFTGTIIPDFVDGAGVVWSIDSILNTYVNTLGIFCVIDTEALEEYDIMANIDDTDEVSGFDMIGHNIAGSQEILNSTDTTLRATPDAINWLSYKMGIKNNYTFDEKSTWTTDYFQSAISVLSTYGAIELTSNHLGKRYGYFYNHIKIKKDPEWAPGRVELDSYNTLLNQLQVGTSLVIGGYADTSTISIPSYKITDDAHISEKIRNLTVGQVFETLENGQDVLNILLTHPEKRKEMNDFRQSVTFANLPIWTSGDPAFVAPVLTSVDGKTTLTVPTSSYDIINNAIITASNLADGSPTPSYMYLEDRVNRRFMMLSEITFDNTANTASFVFSNSNIVVTLSEIQYNYKLYINTNPVIRPLFGMPGSIVLYPALGITTDQSDNITLQIIQKPDLTITDDTGSTPNTGGLMAYKYSKLGSYIDNNVVQSGDNILVSNYDNTVDSNVNPAYMKLTLLVDSDGVEYWGAQAYESLVQQYDLNGQVSGFAFEGNNYPMKFDGNEQIIIKDSGIDSTGTGRPYYNNLEIIDGSWNPAQTIFNITLKNAEDLTVSDYVVSRMATDVADEYTYRLSRVLKMTKKIDRQGLWIIEVTVDTPAYIQTPDPSNPVATLPAGPWVVRVMQIDDYAITYNGFYLDGFTLKEQHLPGTTKSTQFNTEKQLNRILSVLDPTYSQLQEYLSSTDFIDFRYLIDTFNGGLESMCGPKTYLSNTAMKRGQCLALINPPSMQEFSKSTNPRFTSVPDNINPKPELDTFYINQGGNLDLNPSFTWSLPDEMQGSKYAGFLTPNVVIRDNGKNFSVPPASYYSNLLILKFLNGRPFDLAAGLDAIISEPKAVGLEYNFTDNDVKNLTSIGLNVIRDIPGNGLTVMSNQLAYQRTSSAFNSLHVRDLLITIERDVNQILRRYLFKKNNSGVRTEIVERINRYLDGVRALEGIYEYQTMMNETNNTNEVIDANTGIISIAIVPQKAMEKMLLNVIVAATGKLSVAAAFN